MKQQVILINGGNTYKNYSAYFKHVEEAKLSIERMRPFKSWKSDLQENLGEEFDILIVPMPNRDNSDYSEWSRIFDKVMDVIDPGAIFLGHSLGGIFIAKYLNLHRGYKARATILLAAPFNDETNESLGQFYFPDGQEMSMLEKQAGEIYLLQSKDDKVVPFSEVEKWSQHLPNAKVMEFDGYGHFNMSEFPEMIGLIKNVSVA